MFLPEFNTRQLQRNCSEIQDKALKEPVVITRQGKEGIVMLSKSAYAELVKKANQGK